MGSVGDHFPKNKYCYWCFIIVGRKENTEGEHGGRTSVLCPPGTERVTVRVTVRVSQSPPGRDVTHSPQHTPCTGCWTKKTFLQFILVTFLRVLFFQHNPYDSGGMKIWRSRVMTSPNAVSMSMTTALIYGMSGGFFFLLVFLLVLMGMTNCDWPCCRFYDTLLYFLYFLYFLSFIQYVLYSIIQYPIDKIWKYLFLFACFNISANLKYFFFILTLNLVNIVHRLTL